MKDKPRPIYWLFLLIILIYSCQVLCPCKKTPPPVAESSYAKWRNQYIMKDLSASEYIDLLEGEIDRLNRVNKIKK